MTRRRQADHFSRKLLRSHCIREKEPLQSSECEYYINNAGDIKNSHSSISHFFKLSIHLLSRPIVIATTSISEECKLPCLVFVEYSWERSEFSSNYFVRPCFEILLSLCENVFFFSSIYFRSSPSRDATPRHFLRSHYHGTSLSQSVSPSVRPSVSRARRETRRETAF